jgi:ubiquinone biosynthesis protein UbiJ
MNLQTLTADVKTQSEKLASFGHTLKFEIEDMGIIWIDARANPPRVSNDDHAADCTITMSQTALQKVLVENSMSPVLAVSLGEITVDGSKELAQRFLALMPEEDDWDEDADDEGDDES